MAVPCAATESTTAFSAVDNESLCEDLDYYKAAAAKIEMPLFCIVFPTGLLLRLIGHGVCLLAFYRQAKKESGYCYQIALTSNEIFRILLEASYYFGNFFFWSPNGGSAWFLHSYALVFYAAHLSVPLYHVCYTNNLRISCCMAGERVFAMWKVVAYKQANHKLIRIVSLILCVTIGFLTSVFEYFQYSNPVLNTSTDYYELSLNMGFLQSFLSNFLAQLRNAVWLCAWLVLLILNVSMTILYRNHARQMAQMIIRSGGQQKAMSAEMILTLITAMQSCFIFLETTSGIIFLGTIYIRPAFVDCEAYLWVHILNTFAMVMEICNCYVLWIVSRRFRALLAEHVPCLKRLFGYASPVHPIAPGK